MGALPAVSVFVHTDTAASAQAALAEMPPSKFQDCEHQTAVFAFDGVDENEPTDICGGKGRANGDFGPELYGTLSVTFQSSALTPYDTAASRRFKFACSNTILFFATISSRRLATVSIYIFGAPKHAW